MPDHAGKRCSGGFGVVVHGRRLIRRRVEDLGCTRTLRRGDGRALEKINDQLVKLAGVLLAYGVACALYLLRRRKDWFALELLDDARVMPKHDRRRMAGPSSDVDRAASRPQQQAHERSAAVIRPRAAQAIDVVRGRQIGQNGLPCALAPVVELRARPVFAV